MITSYLRYWSCTFHSVFISIWLCRSIFNSLLWKSYLSAFVNTRAVPAAVMPAHFLFISTVTYTTKILISLSVIRSTRISCITFSHSLRPHSLSFIFTAVIECCVPQWHTHWSHNSWEVIVFRLTLCPPTTSSKSDGVVSPRSCRTSEHVHWDDQS